MRKWIKKVSGSIYAWCVAKDAEVQGYRYTDSKKIADREIAAISESLAKHFDWQDREQRILSERLGRRYDLGMALNESANRAIKERDKDAAKAAPQLTGSQLKALEFQKRYLQNVVAESPNPNVVDMSFLNKP